MVGRREEEEEEEERRGGGAEDHRGRKQENSFQEHRSQNLFRPVTLPRVVQLAGHISRGFGDLAALAFTPANLAPEQRQQLEAQSDTLPNFSSIVPSIFPT
ncbi:unnamed protein product [Pleuronectes platessa]|uniref:Uncharacterized protein n=1 Tax=Pleuronectes platessa TaxID=8262 RepID=A0A9N7Z8X7_PLEPL|nr:unnamed protein product [Pleuronectes platessa]